MKYLVITVALLAHQVLGDGSTQLVTRASNEFANKFYEKVATTPGNVLICPISLHIALALVHQGAGGKTASELASVLRLTGTNEDIKESYKSVLASIKDETLKIATKLFPAVGYKLNDQYVGIAQNYFWSDVENVDYTNPAIAASKINKYVEEKTNNKIHDLISPDSITDLTKLIVVNAVHFQAQWKKTFSTAYNDYFKVTPTEKVRTKMMTQTDYFFYKEDPVLEAKVLKMDYSSGDYSMLFVLPNKDDGLRAMEAKLVNTPLENLLKDMAETKVEVTIPKFKLEQTLNLVDTLAMMGIKEVFSDRADLSKVSSGEQLHVSDVIQKTYINVHENGTEAAAATVFLETLSANSDEAVFYARRPFHFYLLRDKTPQMVLFEGRFVRPQDGGFPVPILPSEQADKMESITFVEESDEDKNKITNNRQGITNQNQMSNNNNVVSGNQNVRPVSQNVQPGSQNVQPGSQNVWPGNQNIRPGSQNVQPVSQNVQPGSQNVWPGNQNIRSGNQNVQPGGQNVWSGSQNVRPDSQNVQPGRQNVQPGNQNVQSGSQNVQPAYTQNPPQNTNYNAQQPGQFNPEPQPDYNNRFGFSSTVRPVQPQLVQSFPGQYQQPTQQQSFQPQPFQQQSYQQQPYQQQNFQQQQQQYYQQSNGQQSYQFYEKQQVYRRRVQHTQSYA